MVRKTAAAPYHEKVTVVQWPLSYHDRTMKWPLSYHEMAAVIPRGRYRQTSPSNHRRIGSQRRAVATSANDQRTCPCAGRRNRTCRTKARRRLSRGSTARSAAAPPRREEPSPSPFEASPPCATAPFACRRRRRPWRFLSVDAANVDVTHACRRAPSIEDATRRRPTRTVPRQTSKS